MKAVLAVAIALPVLNSCKSGEKIGSIKKAPVRLEQAWATDAVFKTPESVLYDAQRNVLYVSNINNRSQATPDGDGFISRLNSNGTVEQLFWVSGLNDPKGMALYNGVLYVADINQVVAIASQTGSVIARYEAEGAQGLNDITVDESGNLYISDKEGKKIYQLRNGRLSLWLDNTQGQEPNGLVAENNQLLTNFSTNGTVKKIDLNNKTVTDWLNGIPSADGLVSDGRGNYFISNWNGEIYYATGLGNIWLVLGTKDQKINSADIGMSTRDQTLFVPTFFDNRVVAYRIMQQNN